MLSSWESDFENNSFKKDEETNFLVKMDCLTVYWKGF